MWIASVYLDGRVRVVGTYEEEDRAARAHDLSALALFGTEAVTNEVLGLLREDCDAGDDDGGGGGVCSTWSGGSGARSFGREEKKQ